MTDGVQKRGLAVVDMAHDGHDRCKRLRQARNSSRRRPQKGAGTVEEDRHQVISSIALRKIFLTQAQTSKLTPQRGAYIP